MGENSTRRGADPLAFLAGGGEMGERTRAFDWSANPLGPPASWPQGLQAAASICLNSRFPIVLWWGSDLRLIYNDAWRPVLGRSKHPQALGSPGREVWPEIWHIIGPMLEGVLSEGQATWSDDQLLPLDRNGYLEEAYFTYSYSPILGDGGKVGGVFAAVSETTQRVVGERRLKTLRALASHAASAKTTDEACRTAIATLAADPSDVTFALLYLLAEDEARLADATGLPEDHPARPARVPTTGDPVWPLPQVVGAGPVLVDLDARHGELPATPWPVAARQAVLLPLMASGQDRTVGVLVLGVNPGRALDDEHRGFHDLVAGHVATAIANARAYEEERRRAEALAELDRAKTAFFSNVSHEFRTPLTLMLGPVEDMLAKPAEQVLPDNRELLTVVHRNGLRLQRLVNSLLDFSRIEAGRVKAAYEPTDLAEFTADLASNFRSACEKAGLRLRVDCPPLSGPVLVDRPMYEKVVLNLLSNAFKFTFDGEIAVSLRQAGESVELRVRDTGTGIPADEMPRLFERFHRVENARGRTHEGSGIGLALVQELVKLHGGSITVESEVGRGTAFTVSLPLGADHLPPDQVRRSRAAPTPTAAVTSFVQEALHWLPQDDAGSEPQSFQDDLALPLAGGGRPAGDRPRILVADDNADMRRYVVRLLSGQFTVEAVPDGEAALEAVRRERPDLILSDVMMPRLDGFGLLRELRNDPGTGAIPVIMLSARAGEESRVEGVEAGANDYLIKPFSARELLARVTAQVQLARLRREAGETLRAQQEELREAQRVAHVGSWRWDAATDATTGSDELYHIYGLDPATRAFPDFRDQDGTLYPHEEWERISRAVGETMRTGVGYELDVRAFRNGEPIWVTTRSEAVKDAAGTVVGLRGTVQDITDRKRAEETLRQSEEYLRAVVQTTPACIKVVAADGTLVSMNSAGLAMVDAQRPEDVQGGCVYGIIRAEYRDAFREFNERVCRGQPGTLEFEIEGLRGTRRSMETHAAPLRGPDGQYRQLAITHDITDRKRVESLQAGQRGVLEMIATGTPLPDVLGAVCRLIEDQEPGLLCSILLTDDTGRHTGTGFGPSLPSEFVKALEGIDITPPHVGSCCRALDSGQEVTVADIENDGRWSPRWRDLNLAYGLRACLSIPVRGSDGRVVASVAVFRRQPGDPGPTNRELLGIATHLAGVAIERRRAESALRESERRFRHLADAMPQIVWTARPDGEIDYLNRRWAEFTGLPEDIGNEGWAQILHPEDAPAAREQWAASLRGGVRFEKEVRLLDRGRQSYRWHLIRTVAVQDDAGQVVRWYGTSTEIHQQKRAEEASRFLAEASAALAGVVDYESTLQKVVNLAVPYFGDWSAVDVAGGDGGLRRLAVAHQDGAKIDLVRRLMQEYPPDPQSPVGAYAVHRSGKPQFIPEITDELLTASATDERHLGLIRSLGLKSYICVPLVVSGAPLGVLTFATAESGRTYTESDLALATDLAQRAAVAVENTQLYQALRDADRRKDEFLATLAHELRNPLAPLRNGLQIMRLAGANGDVADQARTMMERQLGQMVHLIDDLLDLSRISRGKIELRKERVELTRVVQQAVETSRPAIEQAGHDFLIDVPTSPVYVDADVTRLAQVFSNLLNNAAKYTERGGRIRLTVQRHGAEAVVSVRDTGIGIPAHMLPHVFEMFTQVDRHLERAQGGLGIGLSIVKRLVEMHGGSVTARSDGHGMGSEFVVRLPVVLSVVPPRSDVAEPERSSGRRVLVVDDNRDAAVSLAIMLQLMGNEAKTAHDGLEALDVAAAYRPDLILLDIGMPRMNGYDTARHIRQQAWAAGVVLVALTGWGQDTDRHRSQEAGFDSHMTKPLEPAALEKLLASLKVDTG